MSDNYYYDAYEVHREKSATPRATALLNLAHDVLDETNDEKQRLAIGGVIFALTTHRSTGQDVPEQAAKDLEERLREGKVAR